MVYSCVVPLFRYGTLMSIFNASRRQFLLRCYFKGEGSPIPTPNELTENGEAEEGREPVRSNGKL
jgi:hypothetical protein